jgi:sirohydrochlorin ferrochelatase
MVFAVPGSSTPQKVQLLEELTSLARIEQYGADVRFGFLDGEEHALVALLQRCAAERTALTGSGEAPHAVVVPLLAAPHPEVEEQVRKAVADSGAIAPITSALGPHPLLAEALHVRLSESGLSRADRARLFTISTSADGIVLATTGGPDAVQATEATGVLLAARLAVQVVTVSLDEPGTVTEAVLRLRAAGAQQPVVAAGVIGPELAEGRLAKEALAADCGVAEPLGAYPGVARLALLRYTTALPVPVPAQP